jgi:DNA-directed RNA polymerase alpha subunit
MTLDHLLTRIEVLLNRDPPLTARAHEALDDWERERQTINDDVLTMHLEATGLDERTANSLARIGLFTVKDVVESSDAKLLTAPNFSRGSLLNVRNFVKGFVVE